MKHQHKINANKPTSKRAIGRIKQGKNDGDTKCNVGEPYEKRLQVGRKACSKCKEYQAIDGKNVNQYRNKF